MTEKPPAGKPTELTNLSPADVDRLLVDRSAENRIATMQKVVAELDGNRLDDAQAVLARDVLARFARDAEVAVRQAVAWQIYNSPLLSDEMAEQLARDVGQVAFPVLRHAERLGDDILLQALADDQPEKQVAIAGRDGLSPVVSDAIVETANLKAIDTLLRNETADIRSPTLEKVADRYGDIDFIAEPLANRPQLPIAVVEKLIHRVSEDLRRVLIEKNRLSPAVVADLIGRGREAATMLMLPSMVGQATDVELLAKHLHMNGRLTPSLLFRALCAGDLDLFVAGIATRAGIAPVNARTLLLDGGERALKALFERAKLSILLLQPFRVALTVVRELGFNGDNSQRRNFQITVLARVFAECGHIEERAVDDLLMQLFDQKSEDMIEQAMDMAGMPFLPLRGA